MLSELIFVHYCKNLKKCGWINILLVFCLIGFTQSLISNLGSIKWILCYTRKKKDCINIRLSVISQFD